MEPVDIYDQNRNKTGIIKYRGRDTLEPGEYIVAVDAFLLNSQKQLLLSKRAMTKKNFPGYWEIGGGGLKAGEDSLTAVVRETKEELGILLNPQKGRLLRTVQNEFKFKDIWTFKVDIAIEDLMFADGEVSEAKWVSFEEFEQYKKEDKLIDTSNITREDYEKSIEFLEIK